MEHTGPQGRESLKAGGPYEGSGRKEGNRWSKGPRERRAVSGEGRKQVSGCVCSEVISMVTLSGPVTILSTLQNVGMLGTVCDTLSGEKRYLEKVDPTPQLPVGNKGQESGQERQECGFVNTRPCSLFLTHDQQ